MNAGPWLPVPPDGYGGIENVVAALVPELRRRGIRVLLATVARSTLPAAERLTSFRGGQFEVLQRPYNQVSGVAHAHMHAVVRALRDRDDIDLVHDHVEVVGLAVLAAGALGPGSPPVLHTLHWDLGKHDAFYSGLDAGPRVRVNGVSASQLDRAPEALRRHSVGHVHLATPLAAGADRRPPTEKAGHAVVRGRITAGKGQHLAARLARECGFDLVLAGPVGPYRQPAGLTAAGAAAGRKPGRPPLGGGVAPHAAVGRARRDGGSRGAGSRHPGRRAGPRLPAGTRRARTHRMAGEVTGRSR